MKALVINTKAIKENIGAIKLKAAGTPIYAELTGDAFGVGLLEAARLLRDEGIDHFAVSEPEDAARLREDGYVEEEILMIRSTTDPEELARLLDLKVICTVGSYETAVALDGVAGSRGTVAEAHLQVDSGVGYGGFLLTDVDKILQIYQYLPNIAVAGIFTQVRADGRTGKAEPDAFKNLVGKLRESGVETGIVYAAGVGALFAGEELPVEAVRIGGDFFGRTQLSSRKTKLQPVAWIEATVCEIRWVPKGHAVGSEDLVTVKEPTRVAVVPVGYYDGVTPANLEKKGLLGFVSDKLCVRLGEQKIRVIGDPGMLETLLNVTKEQCVPGDKVVIDIDPLWVRGLKREYR